MLSADDIAWIKQNRSEIIEGRTETVAAQTAVQGGADPITGEPLQSFVDTTFDVIWEEAHALQAGERQMIGGIAIEKGDAAATFNETDDPSAVEFLIRNGKKYKIIAIQEQGIGGVNRWTCLVRGVV